MWIRKAVGNLTSRIPSLNSFTRHGSDVATGIAGNANEVAMRDITSVPSTHPKAGGLAKPHAAMQETVLGLHALRMLRC